MQNRSRVGNVSLSVIISSIPQPLRILGHAITSLARGNSAINKYNNSAINKPNNPAINKDNNLVIIE